LSNSAKPRIRVNVIYTIAGPNYQESIDAFKAFSENQRRKIQVLQGHMGFGLHEFLPQRSVYITMLRDPIDRVISHYYYGISKSPRAPDLCNKVTSQPISLEEYVSSGIRLLNDNGQTRLLSAVDGTIWDKAVGFGQCPIEMLEKAKRNLQEHFAVVGLLERFDETILLFKRTLGWKRIPFYVKRRATPNRPRKEDIPAHILHLVEEYNELDIMLYNYAREIFEEQIHQQDPALRGELRAFQLLNRIYGAVYLVACVAYSPLKR
jgi:hypothetical protein